MKNHGSKKGAAFTKAPGANGVRPTTGGTSGTYGPKGCAAKRKSFKTGTGY